MKHTVITFVVLIIGLTSAVSAQDVELSGLEAGRYYDFWIGTWELSWEEQDGSTGRGTNTIRRILGGEVLEENFEATEGRMKGFSGKSWSVYDRRRGEWKQTWVDSQGSYLDFTGRTEGDKRIFRREGLDGEGNRILQRMVFFNISRDSLTWDWEISRDGGESWELSWRIHYSRIK